MEKILEWICPECGKRFVSLYEKQFTFLKEQHILKHKVNKDEQK